MSFDNNVVLNDDDDDDVDEDEDDDDADDDSDVSIVSTSQCWSRGIGHQGYLSLFKCL
jgi:hypothetical protein